VGGKLEVKMRIRDPFKSKQVEEVKEKWLVIDQFFKTIDKVYIHVCSSSKPLIRYIYMYVVVQNH
jgi:hypothetical protein